MFWTFQNGKKHKLFVFKIRKFESKAKNALAANTLDF